MHIKQITISNFRSFKQQPEIQPFSPGTNSIVGRNGSGKSNLFDAVQFALLSPRFFTLRTVRTLYERPWLSFLYVCVIVIDEFSCSLLLDEQLCMLGDGGRKNKRWNGPGTGGWLSCSPENPKNCCRQYVDLLGTRKVAWMLFAIL